MSNFPLAVSESTAQMILEAILFASLAGTIVCAVAWCLSFLFRARIKPGLLKVIWLLVLVRFALFLAPESPASILNLWNQKYEQTTHPVVLKQLPQPEIIFDRTANSQRVDAEELLIQAEDDIAPVSASQICLCAWLIGVAFVLSRFATNQIGLIKLVKRAERPTGDTLAQLSSIVGHLEVLGFHKLRRKSDSVRITESIRITEQLQSPAVAGLFRPVLLLPRWCLQELSQRQLEQVIAHELVHLGQRDLWISFFGRCTAAIHWFTPFIHFVRHRLETASELYCDNVVVSKFGSAEPESTPHRIYGEAILAVASRFENSTLHIRLSGSFVLPNKQLVKQRIAVLTTDRSPSGIATMFLYPLLIALVLCGYTSAQSTEPTTKPSKIDVDKQDVTRPILQESQDHSVPKPTPGELSGLRTANLEPQPTILPNPTKPTAEQQAKLKLSREYAKELLNAFPNVKAAAHITSKGMELAGSLTKEQKKKISDWHQNQAKWKDKKLEFAEYIAIQFKVYKFDHEKLHESVGQLEEFSNEKQRSLLRKLTQKTNSRAGTFQNISKVEADNFFTFAQRLGTCELTDQPTLIAKDRRTGEFLRGGELPISVENPDGSTRIDFKPFGTQITVRPLLKTDSKLKLEFRFQHTELAKDLFTNEGIPGFRVRRVSTATDWDLDAEQTPAFVMALNLWDVPQEPMKGQNDANEEVPKRETVLFMATAWKLD